MRKTIFGVALATTILAGPALAKDKSWYVGAEVGAILAQNQSFDIRNAAGTQVSPDALRTKYRVGYDAGGFIGYDFGPFRAEFEMNYKKNRLDEVNIFSAVPALPFGTGPNSVPATGNYPDAAGNARVLSFMGNGLIDFGGQDMNLGGFIGAGAGVARVLHSQLNLVDTGRAFMNDSDTGFAWQALAGIYKPVSKNVDVGLKYRYFNVPNVQTFTFNGLRTDTNFRSHSLMFTLAYNFFNEQPAPPPPPPPPPAPPVAELPPCPPPAVTPGPFLVFFDWDKSNITAEAAAILDRAAEQYMATGQTSVALAGHADRSGKDDYNLRLSQRRADAVKAYLAGKGVPESAMVTEAFGESRPLVETADGVREPQNRRVEITFSGAPMPASTGPCRPM
jgi:outer membrane protein OmpA-like peptidoglycan-associated protein/opacity protein-like surface antigen